MVALRIFSYLPNPRIWKATITARLCGVEIEVRGASPRELSQWLWDFDARPIAEVPAVRLENASMTVRTKCSRNGTERRRDAGQCGTHWSDRLRRSKAIQDGRISRSAAIMRAVARLGAERFPVYGRNVYESSRIDAFLDASLVFARDGQIYLLALSNGEMSSDLYSRMKGSFAAYLSGIEQALAPQRGFLVGDNVTLADVCFVSELCLFHNERARSSALKTAGFSLLLDNEFAKSFPRSAAHFRRLLGHPAFVPDVAGYLEKIERNDGRVN